MWIQDVQLGGRRFRAQLLANSMGAECHRRSEFVPTFVLRQPRAEKGPRTADNDAMLGIVDADNETQRTPILTVVRDVSVEA